MPNPNDIDDKIRAVNDRLRHAKVRLAIRRMNKKLYLQGTFPPKPGSDKTKPHQQMLALGVSASPAGLKVAQAKAKEVSAALDLERFDWSGYLKLCRSDNVNETQQILTIKDWVERFEEFYFSTRPRTLAKLSTYREDLYKQFVRFVEC